MIKSFEQFINENYNVTPVVSLNEEYGAPFFNEVSESLMYKINESINEGKLVLDANMIEEGLFDTIGKLFKKGADKASQNNADNDFIIAGLKNDMKAILDMPGNMSEDIMLLAKELESTEKSKENYAMIEDLCKSAEEICKKLADKEEEMYKTISEKMTAANEAVKEFTDKTIDKINDIVSKSKNKIADVISTVILFCKKMLEISKSALEKIGKGLVFAAMLPILFAYSVYKGALKICNMLVEKIKEGSELVKESFIKIKNAISNWVVDMLKQAKEILKRTCDSIKDGAKTAYNAIGKAYLSIVAILGQLVSDTKDKISEAYNNFVDGVNEFSDEVKSFISEKWDVVSKWCKKTATAFADGVKNVWNKMKEKVVNTVNAAKDSYKALEDNAKSTWDDVKKWSDEKQKEFMKANMKYSVDKWGKDEVNSWIENL